jgi:hypothetical protein
MAILKLSKEASMKKIGWALWVAIGLTALFVAVLVFIKLVTTYKLESMFGWNGWTDLSLVAMDIVFVAPAAGVFWIIGAIQTIRRRRSKTGA